MGQCLWVSITHVSQSKGQHGASWRSAVAKGKVSGLATSQYASKCICEDTCCLGQTSTAAKCPLPKQQPAKVRSLSMTLLKDRSPLTAPGGLPQRYCQCHHQQSPSSVTGRLRHDSWGPYQDQVCLWRQQNSFHFGITGYSERTEMLCEVVCSRSQTPAVQWANKCHKLLANSSASKSDHSLLEERLFSNFPANYFPILWNSQN